MNAATQRVLASQGISQLGDQFVPVVLAVSFAGGDGNVTALGVAMGARTLGLAVCLLFGGALVDGTDKATIIRTCDAGRAFALLVTVTIGDIDSLAWAGVVMLVLGGMEGVARPAYQSIYPSLVTRREELPRINSWASVCGRSSILLGPGLAALVIAHWSIDAALTADLASFIASLALLGGVHPGTSGGTSSTGLLQRVLDSRTLVLRRGWIRTLFLLNAIHVLVAVAPWQVILPATSVEAFGAAGFAWLISSFGLGALIGGFAARWVHVRRPAQTFIALSTTFVLMPCALASLSHLGLALAVGIYITIGALLEVGAVLYQTMVQMIVADQDLGRVFSLMSFASLVVNPCGMALAATAGRVVTIELLVAIGSGLMIASSMVALRSTAVSTVDREYAALTLDKADSRGR